jgi:hypothetical protein
MKLFDERRPLKIIHPIGGERIIAYLSLREDGILFLDIGWPEAIGQHVIHFVKGRIEGDGPWRIGDCEIMVVKPDDFLMRDYKEWIKYKKANNITDERAEQVIKEVEDDIRT